MHFDLQDIEKYFKNIQESRSTQQISLRIIDIFVEINQILDWKIKVQKEIEAVK